MNELNFDTGIVTYTVNKRCDVSFNPTDSNFVERLFNAFDDLDKRQERYKSEVSKMTDKREVFDFSHRLSTEMRETIDGIFEAPVCEALFGKMDLYAMASGLPVWCNFMLSIMDECDSAFAREQKAMNPRIQKYTAKYHK